MTRAWQTLERVETADGALELRRRGPGDFLITQDGRVLMNSRARRSEEELATLALARLARAGERGAAHVVLAGLGMGCTLRAALDALPAGARITACELHAPVAAWCRGPLAELCGDALADPRVRVVVGDVVETIRALAAGPPEARADAILLDLFAGPHHDDDPDAHPVYGARALARALRALAPDGVLAIWSEAPDEGFETRLVRAGFVEVALHRPGRGGRRHAVYLARAPGPARAARGRPSP